MHSPQHGRSLKLLASLYGSGKLSDRTGGRNYGAVAYELHSYSDRFSHSDNGWIEGEAHMLRQAFRAGPARLDLADGQIVDVVLDDPRGHSIVEIKVKGHFPAGDHDA